MAAKKIKGVAVVLPGEMESYLRVAMQNAKLDVLGYAKKIGVTRELVYMVMNGSRKPSKDFLDRVGLKIAYRIPGAPLLLSEADLQMYVVVKLQDSKLDLKEYAKKIGIHPQTLYTILAGVRLPPKSLIDQYGLETVYRIL